MRVITAIKENPFLAIFSAIGIFFLTPIIQFLVTPLAFEIWFKTLIDKPLNAILYIAFSLLFGAFISLYFYAKNKCEDCKAQDVRVGFGGALVGFVLGVCPACFSLIGALLPLAGSIFLTIYSPVFILLSIIVLVFSINKLGGLKGE